MFVPNDRILPNGLTMGSLAMRINTVVLQVGFEGKVFEGEWHSQRCVQLVWAKKTCGLDTLTLSSPSPRSSPSPPSG